MAVWSEVDSIEAERIGRLDADYYRPEFLALDKLIKNSKYEWKYLEELSTAPITKGETPLWRGDDYEEEGVLFLRSENLEPCGIKDTNQVYITDDVDERMKRSRIESGDVLIAIVGATTGMVGLVPEDDKSLRANINQAVARIRNLKLNKFLSIYLLSNIAQMQVLRFSGGGAARDNLDLHEVRRIQCPILNDANFIEIENYVTEIQTKRNESKTLYQEAEALLLHELGLDALDLSNQVTYESSFDEFARNSRLDSEFYQPKYQILAYALSSIGAETVGSWGKALKGKSVSEYVDEGIPVIRSGDLTDINNDENFKYASSEEDLFYLKRGDVLISSIGFGSIGKVQVFEGEDNAFATVSEVTVIRQNRLNPYYLQLFLQSVGGQLQIEKWITGATGQLHLYPRDVEKFLIPILEKGKQDTFEELIKNAVSTKEQAKQLLEDAKRRVEDMILGA